LTYLNDDKKENNSILNQEANLQKNNLNMRMMNDDTRLIFDEYEDYFHKFDTIKNNIDDDFKNKEEISADYLFKNNQPQQDYYKSYEAEAVIQTDEINLESHLEEDEDVDYYNFYTDKKISDNLTPINENNKINEIQEKIEKSKDEFFDFKDYLKKDSPPDSSKNDSLDEFSDYFA
jgi:hypothetical protein